MKCVVAIVSALICTTMAVPDSIDWRQKGYVTPVINQHTMGSSCAIAAVEAVEGQHFRASGKLIPLSAQQVADCFAENCGGDPSNVFDYIHRVGGIESQKTYPYADKKQVCMFNKSKVVATVDVFAFVSPANEDALKEAVGRVGPVTVTIDAGGLPFQTYKSGIHDDPNCGYTLDHAVLVVGYGSEDGVDYWIVKNSWGTAWGEGGYIRMARNKYNQCGIATDASYPIIYTDPRLKKRFFVELN